MRIALTAALIANRGEIAMHIARAVRDTGLNAIAVHSVDDAASLHARSGDDTRALAGRGAAACLDVAALTIAACGAGCESTHSEIWFSV